MSTKQNYQELVAQFFQIYSVKRRDWKQRLDAWKAAGRRTRDHEKIEGLMAQIEDYHNALQAILAHEEPDLERIYRLHKEMKACYKELKQVIKPMWQQWVEAIVIAGSAAFLIRTYVFGFYQVPTGSAEPNVLVGDRIFGNKLSYMFKKPAQGDLVIFDDPEFVYDGSSSLQRTWQKYVGLSVPLLGLKRGPDNWVKRVVACPGDTIEGRMEDGKTVIYRNGERIEETYINPFPLLVQRKVIGFIPHFSFIGALTPTFLHSQYKEVRYAYDPSVSLEEQPFYVTRPDEVVKDKEENPFLLHPRDPSRNEYGKNVDVFGPLTVPEGKYWVQGDSRRNSRDSRYWGFLDESLVQGRASFVVFSLDSEEPFFIMALLKHPITFFTRLMRWSRTFKGLYAIPNWITPKA